MLPKAKPKWLGRLVAPIMLVAAIVGDPLPAHSQSKTWGYLNADDAGLYFLENSWMFAQQYYDLVYRLRVAGTYEGKPYRFIVYAMTVNCAQQSYTPTHTYYLNEAQTVSTPGSVGAVPMRPRKGSGFEAFIQARCGLRRPPSPTFTSLNALNRWADEQSAPFPYIPFSRPAQTPTPRAAAPPAATGTADYALQQARKCLSFSEIDQMNTVTNPYEEPGRRVQYVTSVKTRVRYSCGRIPGYTHIRVSAVLGVLKNGICQRGGGSYSDLITHQSRQEDPNLDSNFVFSPSGYDNVVETIKNGWFYCVYSVSKWEPNNSVY